MILFNYILNDSCFKALRQTEFEGNVHLLESFGIRVLFPLVQLLQAYTGYLDLSPCSERHRYEPAWPSGTNDVLERLLKNTE